MTSLLSQRGGGRPARRPGGRGDQRRTHGRSRDPLQGAQPCCPHSSGPTTLKPNSPEPGGAGSLLFWATRLQRWSRQPPETDTVRASPKAGPEARPRVKCGLGGDCEGGGRGVRRGSLAGDPGTDPGTALWSPPWAEVTGGRSAAFGRRGPGAGLGVSCGPGERAEGGTAERRPCRGGPGKGL